MEWNDNLNNYIKWNEEIKNRAEKEKIALKIAQKIKNGEVIGFGSGSTSFLAVCAIAEKMKKEKIKITAIPTSYEIKMLCNNYNIPTCSLLEKKPDWCFDGVDEIDENNWMIKGRGAAMFKEKLNILNSPIVYILADNTKFVKKIGQNYPIPVECFPESINYIKQELIKLGATEVILRKAIGKDGPIITENGNLILDTKFTNIDKNLEKNIKTISGVIETGLFIGYNIIVEKA